MVFFFFFFLLFTLFYFTAVHITTFFFDMSIQEGGVRIQTSDLRFMRRDLQLIELLLENMRRGPRYHP